MSAPTASPYTVSSPTSNAAAPRSASGVGGSGGGGGITSPLSPRASMPSYARRSSTLVSLSSAGGSSRDRDSLSSVSRAGTTTTFSSAAGPSTPTSSVHHPHTPGTGGIAAQSGAVLGGETILDRPRDKTKSSQVGSAAVHFLFAEIVSYTQGRVRGISELERRLSSLGYQVGQRLSHLIIHRAEQQVPPSLGGSSTYTRYGNPKREGMRVLPALIWVHSTLWKAVFGKAADSLEKSTENSDEYMISFNAPLFSSKIAVPKEMSQLSVEAFTAGIVEAALDGFGLPARVTAHSVPTTDHPQRTTILVKLAKEVMERDAALGPA
ncbi:TRAPP I complex [Ceraceosorus guamensis]|uniref:TRAPP I complex n=1 Tax=Ceraceosorus guamensis TaxID=1522189 RepID=A0A316VU54_9BASI|nr:TRAPP I complex [Ceraceosorus guamensis]PWN39045.1 TRAPP I complex [Ceraceosorus guamensis]